MASFSLLYVPTIIILSSLLVFAQNSTILFPLDSTLYWTNADSSYIQTFNLPSGIIVRALLLTDASAEIYGNSFVFSLAIYSSIYDPDNWLLTILLLEATNGAVRTDRPAQVVWVAYDEWPMQEGAILRAEQGKGLTLTDSDSNEVWSTNMPGYQSSGMILKGDGNLVIFSSNHSTYWSSFDNPANALVAGQALKEHQKLYRSGISNASNTIGNCYISITSQSLTGFVQYEKPVAYLSVAPNGQLDKRAKLTNVEFHRGGNITFIYELENMSLSQYMNIIPVSIQLLRFDHDGGLRVYAWALVTGWIPIEVGSDGHDDCQYPLVCGVYGVCTKGKCTCPTASNGVQYFTPIDPFFPPSGCQFAAVSDLNSTSLRNTSHLVDFGNLSYFGYFDPDAASVGLRELEACIEVCELNTNCKAAFFRYETNASKGLCYLLPEVLSIRGEPIPGPTNNSVAFIKVPDSSVHSPTAQSPMGSSSPAASPLGRSPPRPHRVSSQDGIGVFSSIRKVVAIVILLSTCTIISSVIWWKTKRKRCCERDHFEQVLGAPVRFSYKELCLATRKFSMRLGRGGFGTVFKGELRDGTLIAVKRLDCIEQGTCEFLAEMKTIGSIHHVSLVKLLGFCIDESNRMLVYEYMSNSSLDKWIFTSDGSQVVSWEIRRRIMLDIARGLAYLHEECSQRIAHLDMKPHNILLDENFNAKISDFGLARLIDRNQSHVTTGMKGTLGYLAPEWQHSRITVKVDIYSFGIVVLEAVSGRRNLDYSQPDSDINLTGILQRKASEGQLMDITDKKIKDLDFYREDILKIIKIGAWCLNEDPSKRPSMSTVVKVLEGTLEIEQNIEFKFSNVPLFTCKS